MKCPKCSIVACLLVLLFLQFLSPAFSENAASDFQVTWKYSRVEQPDDISGPSNCGYPAAFTCEMVGRHIHLLHLSSEDQRVVSNVWFKSNGKGVLNPQFRTRYVSFDYHKIPQVSDLTPAICRELWGAPISSEGGVQTYKLVAPDDKIKDTEYFIDAVFKDDKLVKYQVRSDLHAATGWTKVQTGDPNAIFLITDM